MIGANEVLDLMSCRKLDYSGRMSTSLIKNIENIDKRIQKACLKAQRDPKEVRLLAVSKAKPVSLVLEAYDLGYKRFGENKVQEIEEKSNELSHLDINWCVIGHLQTNKVNKVAKCAQELHSLDSLKLAKTLEWALQKEGRSMEVLIQVNTSDEAQKFGLNVDEVVSFSKELKSFSSLKIKGLMTLALFSKKESLVRPCFVRLRQLQEKLRQESFDPMSWDVLSMGMSQDLEWAIEEGSTEVRVGTALFGERK